MSQPIHTERLILRPIEKSDVHGLFELDSNPDVLKFIGTPTAKTIEDSFKVIETLQAQYKELGIGRWGIIEKETNTFIGWAGLKLYTTPLNNHVNFYELGYRLIPRYWGKGYGTESAKAWLKIAFDKFNASEVIAMTDIQHSASINILKKIGFQYIETFIYPEEPCIGEPIDWYKITNSKNRSQA